MSPNKKNTTLGEIVVIFFIPNKKRLQTSSLSYPFCVIFVFSGCRALQGVPFNVGVFFLPPSNVAELVVQDGCTVLLAPEEVSCESFCEVHDGRADGYFKLYMGPLLLMEEILHHLVCIKPCK